MELVLLHSPLAGPAAWDLLAPVLQARGHAVAVPDLTPVMGGAPPYYERLAQLAADAMDAPSVLVAHSGAGALVPAITALAPVHSVIFADALLPHPGKNWFETAPDALQARLRAMAKDGRLPPWHRWWPDGAIARMLGSAELCERFTAGSQPLPLAYFEERAPDAALATPAAYLQLSDAYASETAIAEAHGWPAAKLSLHHLAMLTHPDAVADGIERLAAAA